MPDLKTFVLAARKSLITETEEQLVQLYGLQSAGELLPEDQVPALSRGEASADALETHRRLKQLLKDEQDAGIMPADAIKKLTKEVAFTHLNRMVALKLLEGRKLNRGAINNWHNSNAFLFYLADHEQEQHLFDQGSQPQDDRNEGPNDRSYRHFLLWQYGKLAEEVRVLFDPDNLASRLFPRPPVLRSIVNDLNSGDFKSYWGPGNEEMIGWVYQFFIAEEKDNAFSRVFKEKAQFQKDDIPAATQIFTPRWIVDYLVQNSLGRLWASMHRDSRLIDEMTYLIPMPGDPLAVTMKPARDLKLLDPATGTMHFGLVAFDWLVRMYREELANTGKSGWPAVPSVTSDREIASSILANNLYGIDIDLRAVQLSALSLYLRAKQTSKDTVLTGNRLACADIAIFRGKHFNSIADELKLPDSVTRHLFSKFCESVDEAAQMGSLVRLEKHIQSMEADRLRAVIEDYVAKKAAEGEDESYFGNETIKGLRLLEIMTQRYDVVFTNPPYMSSSNMNPVMSKFLANNYKTSKGDLYSAFIERCSEMLNDGGRLAMITQQSFMFISGYEDLRGLLTQNTAIETMVHTGPRAFAEVTGEKVNTTAFVLRRRALGKLDHTAVGVYFRVVKENTTEAKRISFEESVARRRLGDSDPRIYEYCQGDFAAICGGPWVYWADESVRNAFQRLPSLKSLFTLDMGLKTSGNVRFVRFWWEVGLGKIGQPKSRSEAAAMHDTKWFWYSKGDKGTGLSRPRYAVNWAQDGKEIKAHLSHQYPYLKGNTEWCTHNEDLYFTPCITWSPVSSTGFRARIVKSGIITSNAAYGIFADDGVLQPLYSYLASTPGRYLIKILCSTINHNKGDLEKLPIPVDLLRDPEFVASASSEIESIKDVDCADETAPTYVGPSLLEAPTTATEAEDIQDARIIKTLQLRTEMSFMREFLSLPLDNGGTASVSGSGHEEEGDESDSVPEDNEPDTSADGEQFIASAKSRVAYAVGVALGRFSPGGSGALGCGRYSEETASRMRSLSSQDGIMVLEKGHPEDLAQRVWDVLRASEGDDEAERAIRGATGLTSELRESLGSFLLGSFFKDHVKKYQKRPIYWLLQSPKRAFSAYVFHERFTANTLSVLQGNRYLGGRINSMETELSQLLNRVAKAVGVERTTLTKRAREIAEIVEDLKAFDSYLGAANRVSITDADGLPKTVRWEPQLDDGVLLNAAPLYDLMPAWKKADSKLDLKKTWNELAAAKYDWAKTAMRYWPARVLKASKENKSIAIAHGLN